MEKVYMVSFNTKTQSSMGVELFERMLEAAVKSCSQKKSYRASFHELPIKKEALERLLERGNYSH